MKAGCRPPEHVFRTDAPVGSPNTTADAPDDRWCLCGAWMWGEMNAKLEATEGLERMWKES